MSLSESSSDSGEGGGTLLQATGYGQADGGPFNRDGLSRFSQRLQSQERANHLAEVAVSIAGELAQREPPGTALRALRT